MRLAEHCGWWWPFAAVAVLTEKSTALHRDAQGRLHNVDGPALDYGGEWSIHAYHGVRVPEHVIMHPETITAAGVLAEPNAEVVRVMLERMGMERFIAEAGATVIDEDTRPVNVIRYGNVPEMLAQSARNAELSAEIRDAFGIDAQVVTVTEQRTLYRVARPDEDIVAVRVTCPSTGSHYLIGVPPSTRTCAQAVAWMAGFDRAEDYQPVLEA